MRLAREGRIVYAPELLGRTRVFADRREAGELLAKACREVLGWADLVLAIPRGGVPVAVPVARALGARLDLLICRKLLIPWNREAGFGAVRPDGRFFVDERFAAMLGLSEHEIEEAVREQLREVEERNRKLRGGRPYPDMAGKRVVLVDDGVAAGYTMRAALGFARDRGASEAIIAVPTGHLSALEALASEADLIVCLNVRAGPVFAVADAYERWRDLTDEDVLAALRGAGRLGPA